MGEDGVDFCLVKEIVVVGEMCLIVGFFFDGDVYYVLMVVVVEDVGIIDEFVGFVFDDDVVFIGCFYFVVDVLYCICIYEMVGGWEGEDGVWGSGFGSEDVGGEGCEE